MKPKEEQTSDLDKPDSTVTGSQVWQDPLYRLWTVQRNYLIFDVKFNICLSRVYSFTQDNYDKKG